MALQLEDIHDIHSKNWYANQAALENKWNQEQAIAEYEGDAVEAQEVHRQTIDQSELYNGMAVQLGDIHSPAYKAIMAEQEQAFEAAEAKKEAEMTTAEKEAIRKENSPQFITDNHIVATSLIPPHRNFDVDTSIYNGMTMTNKEYLQLGDHTNDQDDLVPEFSEEIKPEGEQQMVEQKHFDFAGQEIKEIYDE